MKYLFKIIKKLQKRFIELKIKPKQINYKELKVVCDAIIVQVVLMRRKITFQRIIEVNVKKSCRNICVRLCTHHKT